MVKKTVLIVEDDPALNEALSDMLDIAGFEVLSATDGGAALDVLQNAPVDIVVSDVQMQPMDGYGLMRQLRTDYPELPVLLMTAYGTIEQAVQAMREGAVDYLVKPFEADQLIGYIERVFTGRAGSGTEPVAEDNRSREQLQLARRVSDSDATVMICGESGTGKEVMARYIHSVSPRASGPFVAVNCAAIPDNMLEAMLFGYEKGAFTGAYKASAGKFEQAQGGTLLLDEISEMDLGLQAKLLRVLQEREVERLGGHETIGLNVRVLATTNRRLREEVAAGRFREDLFYRLNVFPLVMPPLRDRPDDILPLARKLIERHTPAGKIQVDLGADATQALLGYRWPGNVRELENVIQRALILCSGDHICAVDLHFQSDDEGVKAIEEVVQSDTMVGEAARLGADLKSHEDRLILDALRSENGSRKNAATRLGISPRTLRYKLARMREAGIALPA